MNPETEQKIEEAVLEILRSSNMDQTTEHKVRKAASELLGLDLSTPERKRLVRRVVEAYIAEQQSKAEQEEDEGTTAAKSSEEEEEDSNAQRKRKESGGKEYDDEGDLIICRLSDRRRVTLQDFRGKTLVSIREYYRRDGKELPTSKGISLTAEQWASFKNNIPAIEKAIKKMESRLD